jgi:hypothetical protein
MKIYQKLNHFITSIDGTGDVIKFTVNKHQTTKTLIGGILTAIIVVLGLFLFVVEIQDTLKKKNPFLASYHKIEENQKEINLNFKNTPIAFSLKDSSKNTFYDKFLLSVYSRDKDGFTYYELIDCPQEWFGKDNYEMYDLHLYKCIRDQNVDISNSLNYKSLRVLVSYCHWDDSDCNYDYYKESKEKFLIEKNTIYLSVMLFNYDFNPFVYEKPQMEFIQEIYSYINLNYYKATDVKIARKNLITDDGLIFPKENIKVINTIDSIEREDQEMELDNYLMMYRIWSSDREYNTNRSYKKLQSVIANVMGIFQILIQGVKFVCVNFSTSKMNVKIMNKIFEFDNASEESNKKIKVQIQKELKEMKPPKDNLDPSFLYLKQNKEFIDDRSADRIKIPNQITERLKLDKDISFEPKLESIDAEKSVSDVRKIENATYNDSELNTKKNFTNYEKDYYRFKKQARKMKKMNLSTWEIIKSNWLKCLCRKKSLKKKYNIYKLAEKQMKKRFEISYVMRNLEEVEKIKAAIFTQQQLSLFNMSTKYFISSNKEISDNSEYNKILGCQKDHKTINENLAEFSKKFITNQESLDKYEEILYRLMPEELKHFMLGDKL